MPGRRGRGWRDVCWLQLAVALGQRALRCVCVFPSEKELRVPVISLPIVFWYFEGRGRVVSDREGEAWTACCLSLTR